MQNYLAEMVGTMILVIFGDGVVANVCLGKTKAHGSGWIVIVTGWGVGVAVAVYCVARISGGHINPAVTIALAAIGQFSWALVPGYVIAQVAGGFLGGIVVWLAFLPHWRVTDDQRAKLSVFCTIPEIRTVAGNFICEVIGTALLLFGVLGIAANATHIKQAGPLDFSAVFSTGINPLLVGVLVWGIGLSLGGPTGYAINPARDLGPRIAHAFLPIPGKGGSDWTYAWIPVVAPIVGGILGAALYVALGF
ncbi:MAG TPA: MIP/aquaporin family protein [Candidatus Bathyarchaeia archaeon]|nr:MIP/aquaporin family protein [Candidatus Bathyarchaeia archaeon]